MITLDGHSNARARILSVEVNFSKFVRINVHNVSLSSDHI